MMAQHKFTFIYLRVQLHKIKISHGSGTDTLVVAHTPQCATPSLMQRPERSGPVGRTGDYSGVWSVEMMIYQKFKLTRFLPSISPLPETPGDMVKKAGQDNQNKKIITCKKQ